MLMIVSLYSSRVILDALGVEDYGIYQVVGGFVALFQIVSNSISSAVTRFITVELGNNDLETLKKVFSTSIIILLLLSLFFIVFIEVFGVWYVNNKMVLPSERVYAANWALQFSALSFAIGLISLPYNALIIAHEKMSTFAFIGVFEALVKLLICLLISRISGFDRLILYAALLMCLSMIVRFASQVYCRKKFVEAKFQFVFDRILFKKMFSFSGWSFIGSGALVLRNQGVDILLNLFFGPVVNAAKAIANQVNGAVTGFCSNFITAINPQIMKQYASGNQKESFVLVKRGARFATYLSYVIALPIILETPFILSIWLKEVPTYSVAFVRLVIVWAISELVYSTMTTLIMAHGDIKVYQIVVGGVQLLSLPLSYFILRLGAAPYYTVVVSIALAIVSMVLRLLFLKYQTGFSFWGFIHDVVLNIGKVIIVGSLVPILLWLSLDPGLMRFFMVGVSSVVCVGLSVLSVGCNEEERVFIIKLAKQLLSQDKEI